MSLLFITLTTLTGCMQEWLSTDRVPALYAERPVRVLAYPVRVCYKIINFAPTSKQKSYEKKPFCGGYLTFP
jgi:hypothetical protein